MYRERMLHIFSYRTFLLTIWQMDRQAIERNGYRMKSPAVSSYPSFAIRLQASLMSASVLA